MTAQLRPVPDIPAEPTLEDEAARYAALDEQHKRIGAELERIKARLRDELEPGKYELAGLQVSIVQPSSFNVAKAAALLTAEQLTSITETSTWISPDLVRQILTPEQLAKVSETTKAISGVLAKAKLPDALYRSACEPAGAKRVTVK